MLEAASSVGGLFHFKPNVQRRLLALDRPHEMSAGRSLSGDKRTLLGHRKCEAFDPKQT